MYPQPGMHLQQGWECVALFDEWPAKTSPASVHIAISSTKRVLFGPFHVCRVWWFLKRERPVRVEAFLKVEGLTVDYISPDGKIHRAVDGIHFSIASGEVVGFLGESGCGKTSTALALLGLLPADKTLVKGSAHYENRDLLALPERDLRRIRGAEISIVFQEPAMSTHPVMRVGQQITEVLRAHRPWNARQRREAVDAILAEVGFTDVERIREAYPHQLSGGQLQRIAIAMALVCRPRLVIADEPTASLDATTRDEILKLLLNLRERHGISILLISHQPAILASLADRIVVMHNGRIVEEGPVRQILHEPVHRYTQMLMDCFARRLRPVRIS